MSSMEAEVNELGLVCAAAQENKLVQEVQMEAIKGSLD